ncbi:hypothetical protein [Pedobacter sp. KLB.chiD]|uniref:hypothetical protein n=1 Tax=Pedobacter sp. KLB.chiD TaxID=3387402 RepID=UPI003999EBDD
MKKTISTALLTLITISAHSQINPGGYVQNNVNSIAPKSADVAALFKYNETPISLYTGIPNINIPLYTIKEGDIEIPISISYHAGGIKVSDEASSIGLGWSLNADGRISQVMGGSNDFSTDGYYNVYSKSLGSLVGSVSNCPTLPWNTSTQTNAFYSDNFIAIRDNSALYRGWDFQPDLFMINLPNKSYKAYLDMPKSSQSNSVKFAISEQANIDFKLIGSPSSDGSYNFQVTDENGIKYYFEKTEITIPMPGWNSISGLSKRLTMMEDPKGNSISFVYSSNVNNYRLAGSKNTRTDFTYPVNTNKHFEVQNGLTDYSKQSVEESYLDRINFSNGSVVFTWSDREDIYNSKKLTSIKVFSNQQLIKEYDFNYDYFIATDNLETSSVATWLGAPNNKIFTHRLKLTGIKNPLTNENYSFGYNTNYNLPNKLSFSADFWGYYNGQPNSDTFIPSPDKYVKGQNVFNVTSFSKDLNNYWYEATGVSAQYGDGHFRIYKDYSPDGKHFLSDRRASMYSLAGMLTTITYPTGGKVEYEFEPNTFSNFPLQSLVNDNTNRQVATNSSINNINGTIYFNNNPTNFSVSGNNVNIRLYGHFGFYYLSTASDNVKNSYWIYIKDKSTGQTIKKIFNPNVGSLQNNLIAETIILQAGSYEMGTSNNGDFDFGKINSSGSNAVLNSCSAKYNEEKSIINGVEHNYSSGGGIRIKSIKAIEKDGTPPIIKNYIYDEITDNGTKITSNGNLADFPKFYEIENRCFEENVYGGASTQFRYKSNPNCTLTPTNSNSTPFKVSVYEATQSQGASTLPQGTHVGYSKVTEQQTGRGKTESFFLNNYTQSCINMAARGNALLIGDGDILKQVIYDNDNNKVKETTYSYKYNYPDNLNTYSIPSYILDPITNYVTEFNGTVSNEFGNLSYPLFGGIIHNYSINLYRSLLEATLIREYFPSGSNSYTETKINNSYSNKYLLTKQSTLFPNNIQQSTNYSYAHEKGNQLMIDRNMVEIPLEKLISQTSGNNTQTLSHYETFYPTSIPTPQSGNLVVPLSEKLYDKLGNASYIDMTYDKYDTKGNLLQYTTDDGTPVSFIYGYNDTEVIAKVEGMKYDDLVAAVSPATIISASNDDASDPTKENLLLDALSNFRKDDTLKGKLVTTYTHDPLIGVTSVTPPSGIREVYQYDDFGRLKEVKVREKDTTGNYVLRTIKNYNYNYKQ